MASSRPTVATTSRTTTTTSRTTTTSTTSTSTAASTAVAGAAASHPQQQEPQQPLAAGLRQFASRTTLRSFASFSQALLTEDAAVLGLCDPLPLDDSALAIAAAAPDAPDALPHGQPVPQLSHGIPTHAARAADGLDASHSDVPDADPIAPHVQQPVHAKDAKDANDANAKDANAKLPPSSAYAVQRRTERLRKSRQSQLLLVSLLENFCMLYDQSGERNRRLFFVLCKQLSHMGIIDSSDFIDELSGVRESYKRAFRQLVIDAMAAVDASENSQRLLTYTALEPAPPATPPGLGRHPFHSSASSPAASEPQPHARSHSDSHSHSHSHSHSTQSLSNSLASLASPAMAIPHRTASDDEPMYTDDGTPISLSRSSLVHPGVHRSGSGSASGTTGLPSARGLSLDFSDFLQPQTSRYKDDFIELDCLGRGAFGRVHRCRNKLDGREYAIKKIRLTKHSAKHLERILREVKLLARIADTHVVRYYSSWFEHAVPWSSSASDASDPSYDGFDDEYGDEEESSYWTGASRRSRQSRQNKSSLIETSGTGGRPWLASESSRDESTEEEEEEEDEEDDDDNEEDDEDDEDDDDIQFVAASQTGRTEASAAGKSVSTTTISLHTASTIESTSPSQPLHSTAMRPSSELTLFIQMELCEQTLHDWLLERNGSYAQSRHADAGDLRESEALACFQHILLGLEHVHSMGLIHRDIKPKNIYWKPDGVGEGGRGRHVGGSSSGGGGEWKLGDFGLATMADMMASEDGPGLQGRRVAQTIGVGTVTYASPEQLDPKRNQSTVYSYPSDVYSLGIILFELLHPLSTSMERASLLSNLRAGILPDTFLKTRPKESALVLWMMADDPCKRPTTGQLLELELFAGHVDGHGHGHVHGHGHHHSTSTPGASLELLSSSESSSAQSSLPAASAFPGHGQVKPDAQAGQAARTGQAEQAGQAEQRLLQSRISDLESELARVRVENQQLHARLALLESQAGGRV
ncbi:kinase-like domain-containing protein [Entophlyctis helioformis]|nr:kinase-like domain-containing protein [Entophlyctis helioformis]